MYMSVRIRYGFKNVYLSIIAYSYKIIDTVIYLVYSEI